MWFLKEIRKIKIELISSESVSVRALFSWEGFSSSSALTRVWIAYALVIEESDTNRHLIYTPAKCSKWLKLALRRLGYFQKQPTLRTPAGFSHTYRFLGLRDSGGSAFSHGSSWASSRVFCRAAGPPLGAHWKHMGSFRKYCCPGLTPWNSDATGLACGLGLEVLQVIPLSSQS